DRRDFLLGLGGQDPRRADREEARVVLPADLEGDLIEAVVGHAHELALDALGPQRLVVDLDDRLALDHAVPPLRAASATCVRSRGRRPPPRCGGRAAAGTGWTACRR